jgi:transcriptional regulator with XRE-family HTH domain
MSQTQQGRSHTKLPSYQDNDWERVGRTLRRFRMMRGMSQDQLSTLMEFEGGHSALSNIERGKKPLTDKRLALAAKALGVDQIEIMRPTGEQDLAA